VTPASAMGILMGCTSVSDIWKGTSCPSSCYRLAAWAHTRTPVRSASFHNNRKRELSRVPIRYPSQALKTQLARHGVIMAQKLV
jgi:hypothetical protein